MLVTNAYEVQKQKNFSNNSGSFFEDSTFLATLAKFSQDWQIMSGLLFNLTPDFSDTSSETLGASSHNSSTPSDFAISTPYSYANEQEDSRSEGNNPKKRPRKGHTKSRRGCFNCKKARIKVSTVQIEV
jgi:hypothetical protein